MPDQLTAIGYHDRMVSVTPAGSSPAAACQRGYGRAVMALATRLETPVGPVSCTVRDLSLGGARLEVGQAVEPGEALWLVLGKVKVFGTVQWARGGQIGIKFEEKLPKPLVLSLRGEAVDPQAVEDAEATLIARKWAGGAPGTSAKDARIADVLGTWNPGSIAAGRSGGRRATVSGAKRQAIKYILYAAGAGALVGIGSFFLI
jgi:hypothetical protein